ncbi:MAG: hypothetical protein MHPSP_000112 [Paramarteilia canceri]
MLAGINVLQKLKYGAQFDMLRDKHMKVYKLSNIGIIQIPGCKIRIFDPGYAECILEFELQRKASMWADAIMSGIKNYSDDGTIKKVNLQSQKTINDLKEALDTKGNNHCAECMAVGPEWANIILGITLCSDCETHHRGLGGMLTAVKGFWLDSWE